MHLYYLKKMARKKKKQKKAKNILTLKKADL